MWDSAGNKENIPPAKDDPPPPEKVFKKRGGGAVSRPASVSLHRKVVGLEQHCARLKQQKRVAEKFAGEAEARAEAASADAAQREAALTKRLTEAKQQARYYQMTAEQRLGEIRHLRAKLDCSFQARVEQDVFRAVEATGDAQVFPYGLTPTLAAVQSKVGAEALQQRARRLEDPAAHPLGLHPGVHEWGLAAQHVLPEYVDI